MDSKILKNKIAISCNGNLKKYFRKVELINRILIRNECNNNENVIRKTVNG